ncbi:sugar ABC transporter permease [Paenibacillus sp. KQZ6P-2]|uniref:Sugar ABC transporter permease n=1 Tax=Paenibacillus mangrovi TaxID=2931978 RepID=A0A9X2B7A2_9BACL|nr:sugar ABC transporter permease [Paenibacillus mangrovi]MCJ8013488.1 sugar ABC transporter permease [Paenibacillus mangrovi]
MLNLSYRTQRMVLIWAFLFIPITLLLLFSYYPTFDLFRLSFMEWDGLSSREWAGLDNYKRLMSDKETFQVLTHNLAYLLGGILQNIAALFFAILLNGSLKGRNIFRVLLFLPFIMNSVATAYMFDFMYDYKNGSINLFLDAVGLDFLVSRWLGDENLVNFSLAFIGMWKFMGMNMIIYLGALQSVPSDIYEAAKIDGANSFQSFRYITMPSIRKVIELNLFLTMVGALEAFEYPFILTKGGPGGASETFVTKTVNTAFNFNNYGLAASMSVVLLLIVLLVMYSQSKVLNRGQD